MTEVSLWVSREVASSILRVYCAVLSIFDTHGKAGDRTDRIIGQSCDSAVGGKLRLIFVQVRHVFIQIIQIVL